MNEDPMNPTAGGMGEEPASVAQRARDYAQGAKEYAQEAVGTARARADEALHRGEDYVRANPVPVVLGALGVGILIGIALTHRDEPTFRERYLDEPIEISRAKLAALLGQSRSFASDASDEAHDYLDPVMKQARQVARKLKFW